MIFADADTATAHVRVTTEDTTVVLSPTATLDAAAGAALVDATAAAVLSGASRVDIDLRTLESFTEPGAAALVTCRDVAGALPEGLHYRTGRGPGRSALLAAYRSDES